MSDTVQSIVEVLRRDGVIRDRDARATQTGRLRRGLLDLHGRRCAYCLCELTIETLVLDHVDPLSQGGRDDPSNLVPSCATCNGAKGAQPLLHFMLRRRAQPRRYACGNCGAETAWRLCEPCLDAMDAANELALERRNAACAYEQCIERASLGARGVHDLAHAIYEAAACVAEGRASLEIADDPAVLRAWFAFDGGWYESSWANPENRDRDTDTAGEHGGRARLAAYLANRLRERGWRQFAGRWTRLTLRAPLREPTAQELETVSREALRYLKELRSYEEQGRSPHAWAPTRNIRTHALDDQRTPTRWVRLALHRLRLAGYVARVRGVESRDAEWRAL